MIYRVTKKTTNSVQPGSGGTCWQLEVLYCGTSLEDARIAYLSNRPADYWYGYGNAAQDTIIEQFESEPEEIDSEESEAVEVEDE